MPKIQYDGPCVLNLRRLFMLPVLLAQLVKVKTDLFNSNFL